MWFLLLTLLETGDYGASSVYSTSQECEHSKLTQEDVCATVSIQIIELPKDNPIAVTELPSISEMGVTE